jgi:hypothetical protein
VREVLLDLGGDNITCPPCMGPSTSAPAATAQTTTAAVPQDRRNTARRLPRPLPVVRVPVAHGARVTPGCPVARSRERVLFATGTFPTRRTAENFAALEPELVRHLHREGVRLVGIDTPSVDLFDSEGFTGAPQPAWSAGSPFSKG